MPIDLSQQYNEDLSLLINKSKQDNKDVLITDKNSLGMILPPPPSSAEDLSLGVFDEVYDPLKLRVVMAKTHVRPTPKDIHPDQFIEEHDEQTNELLGMWSLVNGPTFSAVKEKPLCSKLDSLTPGDFIMFKPFRTFHVSKLSKEYQSERKEATQSFTSNFVFDKNSEYRGVFQESFAHMHRDTMVTSDKDDLSHNLFYYMMIAVVFDSGNGMTNQIQLRSQDLIRMGPRNSWSLDVAIYKWHPISKGMTYEGVEEGGPASTIEAAVPTPFNKLTS